MIIRIALADEADLLLIGAQAVLERQREFSIIGTARTARDLLTLVEREQPEVIILNEWLGGCHALGILEQLNAQGSLPRVIVLGSQADGLLVHDLFGQGAYGYLYRCDDLAAHLPFAVETVMRPRPYLSPTANAEYLVAMRTPLRDWKLDEEAHDILRMLVSGAHVAEIARQRGVRRRHVYSIREKLRRRFGARTNEQLIVRAVAEGFAKPLPML